MYAAASASSDEGQRRAWPQPERYMDGWLVLQWDPYERDRPTMWLAQDESLPEPQGLPLVIQPVDINRLNLARSPSEMPIACTQLVPITQGGREVRPIRRPRHADVRLPPTTERQGAATLQYHPHDLEGGHNGARYQTLRGAHIATVAVCGRLPPRGHVQGMDPHTTMRGGSFGQGPTATY